MLAAIELFRSASFGIPGSIHKARWAFAKVSESLPSNAPCPLTGAAAYSVHCVAGCEECLETTQLRMSRSVLATIDGLVSAASPMKKLSLAAACNVFFAIEPTTIGEGKARTHGHRLRPSWFLHVPDAVDAHGRHSPDQLFHRTKKSQAEYFSR